MNLTSTDEEKGRLLLQLQFSERSMAIQVIETLLAVVLGSVGIAGNSLVCLAVYRNQSLQTKCNYYVTTLAGLDLTQMVLLLVLALPVLISGRWLFGDVVCQLEGAVTVVLGTGSIYIMTWIAVNRYFIMIRTNAYRRFFTKRNTASSIAISLVLSCNFVLSYTLQGFRYSFHPGKALCTFDINKISAGYGLATVATNVTIPFFVIAFCYTRIYLAVREHKARRVTSSQFSARDVTVTKTMFATVCAFLVCWTPFAVVDVLSLRVGPHGLPRQLYIFYSIMTASSSIVNPIIYGAMNSDFRAEFKRILEGTRCNKMPRVQPSSFSSENNG